MHRLAPRVCLAVIGLVALAGLLAPPASAATYTSNPGKYHFDYPDAWTAGAGPGSDAVYLGTAVDGFAPNVVAQHDKNNSIQDDAASLLRYAEEAFDGINATFATTMIQAPRTFTTGSGHLGADYIFERTDGGSGMVLRQRQVLFASEFHRVGVILTLTDNVSRYSSQEANWSLIVDSFIFEVEPEIPADVVITINGGNNTSLEPNMTQRFALNRTLAVGLTVEWFRNGTSVGNGSQLQLTFAEGTWVITAQISNATANRTLTTTVAVGAAPTTPPPSPTASTQGSYSLIPLLAVVAAVGLLAVLLLVRQRSKRKKAKAAFVAGPSSPGTPPPPGAPPPPH